MTQIATGYAVACRQWDGSALGEQGRGGVPVPEPVAPSDGLQGSAVRNLGTPGGLLARQVRASAFSPCRLSVVEDVMVVLTSVRRIISWGPLCHEPPRGKSDQKLSVLIFTIGEPAGGGRQRPTLFSR